MARKLKTMDGNNAAAHVAYAFTDVAAIYPITPSSVMAEHVDEWTAQNRKNLFGQTVRVAEMQSEGGAAGAVHGSLMAGALTTTFTASQGLLLMIPNMYKIAAENLPCVMHVSARALATHALSIFGDHSDVMACRGTGFAMLASSNPQEVMDLAAVAHLASIDASAAFLHFFDGFRTSHEIQKIQVWDYADLDEMMNKEAVAAFRARALNPNHPVIKGSAQNPDIFFQVREACNTHYDELPAVVVKYMDKVNEKLGTDYKPFNYYGAPDAEYVVISMGSSCDALMEVCDYLNANGAKVGMVNVHLYRPFVSSFLTDVIPETVKRIAVLDRCKEMGAAGEPLFQDVCTTAVKTGRAFKIIGGRYGLSSKDTDPDQLLAVFANLAAEHPVDGFTIGINDDVTHLSLDAPHVSGVSGGKTFRCKFWGLGGDGTVGANKNTVHILADAAGMYAQAYFEYDAKKSFGITKSHLRFSKEPIMGSYYVKRAEFVACHNQSYIRQYDMVSELKSNGIFLLNCQWKGKELEENLPNDVKRYLARKNIRFYTIDATDIAMRLGLGSHTNTVLQAAFFAITGLIPAEEALDRMKEAARQSYFAKGDEVVAKNVAAIEAGAKEVVAVQVPAEWADLPDTPNAAMQVLHEAVGAADPKQDVPDVVRRLLNPINAQKGDDLPVSSFAGYENGNIDMGLTAFEKRGIAVRVPQWNAEKCVQCNRCSLVCPHAVIRPFLLNDEEKAAAPEGVKTIPANGAAKGLHFALAVSDFDCTSCGSCAESCPAHALEMVPAELTEDKKEKWDYVLSLSDKGEIFDRWTVKGSQFKQPLVEFSAACAGCGETPYAKLMTQLFGERVYWANGTGCSQAWGASMPGIPYTTNRRGFGPAWTNSLFENNAELCLGMLLSVKQQRNAVKAQVESLCAGASGELKAACEAWLAAFDDFDGSRETADALCAFLEQEDTPEAKAILAHKDQLARKTFWMYGGDGWAYDIGFGGLAHVIASGENVNVFIIDTEVYSNTGGQSSKATQVGAVAQFASSGKRTRKMDIGGIMMSYGNVYVAQVAMGADPNQLIKAIKEAEAFDGPSVIVAYTPCTSHGIRAGMSKVQEEMKRAVESGYWLLYRYDPRQSQPLHLDSKEPKMGYEEFLDGETRYSALKLTFPENAKELFAIGSDEAAKRYAQYKHMEASQKTGD